MTQLYGAFADVLGDSKRLVAGWLRLKPSYTLSITVVIFLCCIVTIHVDDLRL